MRRVLIALAACWLLAACGAESGSPAVTATPPPFAQAVEGEAGAPSSVIERAAIAVITPGAEPVTPTAEAGSEAAPDAASPADSAASEGQAAVAAPVVSGGSYDLVPVDGTSDRPDYLHADLNLQLRGYAVADALANLVDYDGETDPNAPRLSGLFSPNRQPAITNVYRVNQWIWDPSQCEGVLHGCKGPPDDAWEVSLIGLAASPGEGIYPPARGPEVYTGGFVAVVLYAAENRITLKYTREDTVASGYAVHIENVCVDPGLLALYRAQTDANGWHVTGQLPGLRNGEYLGYACGGEIQVAVRDNGTFMDPRSRKDWW